MLCKILGLSVNTLTTVDKYYLLDRDNLTEPIQMQLSKKQAKKNCQFFSAFLKSTSNFEHFEQKDDPQILCISETADCKRHG